MNPSRAAKRKKFGDARRALGRRAGDDQTIHCFVRRESSRVIDAAILCIGLSHRLNSPRVDAFCRQNIIRPAGNDMRDESFRMLPGRLSIARNRSVEQHDFAQRLAQRRLRSRRLQTR